MFKYYLDGKQIRKKDIPSEAIEITTYGDLFHKIKRFISGCINDK